MFARTRRLTLRPGWPEDAPALSRAIGHEAVVGTFAHMPWPCRPSDAQAFLAASQDHRAPALLILAHEGRSPRLIGGIAIHAGDDGARQLSLWLIPECRGRGYATEAGQAMVAIARHALGLRRLHAWQISDDPASGRVLARLGFRATGRVDSPRTAARSQPMTAMLHELALGEQGTGNDPVPLAA